MHLKNPTVSKLLYSHFFLLFKKASFGKMGREGEAASAVQGSEVESGANYPPGPSSEEEGERKQQQQQQLCKKRALNSSPSLLKKRMG